MKWRQNPEIRQGVGFYVLLNAVVLGLGIWRKEILLAGTACILFDVTFLLLTYQRYRKISSLSGEIDRVLHGAEGIDFHQYQEGELAILQSEIRKMTVRLKEQTNLLRQERTYLKDSIADISHQLKTPMTSIHLLLSFLSKADLSDDRRREIVQELEILMRKMEWLINALLLLSKLDAGVAQLKREPVFVCHLLEKAAEPIMIAMELREISFVISCAETVCFMGDFGWSVEAIGNILKNCMEHTQEKGRIQVKAGENELYTEIVIEDTGTGIDSEDLPHIFERFYKGKHASSQSTGIGLSLARRIVVEQNGIVEAQNRPEGGAKFSVRFYKQII